MIAIHATWGPDRHLHLWGEDATAYATAAARREQPTPGSTHPFAARAFEVPLIQGGASPFEALEPGLELVLPMVGSLPGPSSELPAGRIDASAQPDDDVQGSARPWRVPTAALDAGPALRLLSAISERDTPEVGASLRFFGRVALLAVELVARGRMLPSLSDRDGGSRITWRHAPGAMDVGRLAALAAAMPRVAMATRADVGTPTDAARRVLDECLAELLGALVGEASAGVRLPHAADALARAIVGRASVPPAATGPVQATLDRWAASVRPPEGPFRTLFRLVEPARMEPGPPVLDGNGHDPSAIAGAEADASGDWKLEILVGARDDPSIVLPAARVWSDPAPLRALAGADPEESLLIDLARASRLYPPLDAALQQAVPRGLDLDTPGAHAFLRDGAPLLADAGYTVLLPAWWHRRRRRLGLRLRVRERLSSPKTTVGPALGADTLVDYDWRVAIGDAELTEAELERLASLKSGLVRIRGEWVEIAPTELDAARRAAERSSAGAPPTMTVGDVIRMALGVLAAPARLDVSGVEADGWLGAILDGDDAARPEPIPTPPDFRGTLRPYQERGLGWLAFLDRLGFGGILADDMGLGKTPQLLALLVADVPEAERLGPTLLICPMSVVGNWEHEAERFAPGLRVHVHHGASRQRDAWLREAVRDADLVITTYALAARDRGALESVSWRRVVLDEAQEIKNAETDQSRAARAFRAPSRFALTGTPIENRLTELWAIMDFANPGLLGSEATFRQRFSIPIERFGDDLATDRLRRLTAPFILRRVKSDKLIAPDLPDKLELLTRCTLTREQASLYQAVVDDLMPDLEREDEEQAYRGKVLRAILRLKQVCDHPALFLGDGSPLRGRSGKLERLEEILDQVVASGERALVFTQFTEWAELLVPYLRDRFGREVLYLHGGVPRPARDAMVARFATGAVPLFVLSLKAGGKGLNLVAANHVVHYDRWWNPAVEDQASDRAYRIGQTRDVVVRTFVATGTVEEKVAEMLAAKRDLASRVMRAGERAFTELSIDELRAVLALAPDAAEGSA